MIGLYAVAYLPMPKIFFCFLSFSADPGPLSTRFWKAAYHHHHHHHQAKVKPDHGPRIESSPARVQPATEERATTIVRQRRQQSLGDCGLMTIFRCSFGGAASGRQHEHPKHMTLKSNHAKIRRVVATRKAETDWHSKPNISCPRHRPCGEHGYKKLSARALSWLVERKQPEEKRAERRERGASRPAALPRPVRPSLCASATISCL